MDKPVSLSVKQFIIRKMAVSLMTPEKTIEAVINHQFNTMLEATKMVNSMELSGFGRFFFSDIKAKRMLKRSLENKELYEGLLLQTLSTQRRNNIEAKLKNVTCIIKNLNEKINETL